MEAKDFHTGCLATLGTGLYDVLFEDSILRRFQWD